MPFSQEAVMLGSYGFFRRHGGTNEGFIRGLYQEVLGRTCNYEEVSQWLQALANHNGDRVSTARSFLIAAGKELEG
jgi:hypothetical protein